MDHLLTFAVMFFAVSLVAAICGFGGVGGPPLAASAMQDIRLVFWIAVVLFGGSLTGGLVRRV